MYLFCSGTACKLLKGQSYTGSDGSESIKPNPPTNEICAEKCEKRKKDNPNINGMIWYVNTKECWCMIGMRGQKDWSGYDICYYTGKAFYSFLHHFSMCVCLFSFFTAMAEPFDLQFSVVIRIGAGEILSNSLGPKFA